MAIIKTAKWKTREEVVKDIGFDNDIPQAILSEAVKFRVEGNWSEFGNLEGEAGVRRSISGQEIQKFLVKFMHFIIPLEQLVEKRKK